MEHQNRQRAAGLARRLNDALGRATGYHVQRAAAPVSGPAPRPATPKPPQQKAPKKTTGAAAVKVPHHFDDEASGLIRTVRPRTMTSPIKLYSLIQSIRYIVDAGLPGDVVECGVWRGGSMQAAAWTLLACGDSSRHLYLFDTFEGMPPPTDDDRRAADGSSAADLLEQRDKSHAVWAYAGLDDVREAMAETTYPADRVHFVQGMVEDTVPAGAPEQIAVLRLDTDWYASTRHELEQLYPRLVPGGVLILDDYGHWEGARKATEEFLASLDDSLLLLPMATGRIAVKPR